MDLFLIRECKQIKDEDKFTLFCYEIKNKKIILKQITKKSQKYFLPSTIINSKQQEIQMNLSEILKNTEDSLKIEFSLFFLPNLKIDNKKFINKFKEAIKKLIVCIALKRKVIVIYHNDCDGALSALLFKKINLFNPIFIPLKNANLTYTDFMNFYEKIKTTFLPIVFLVDCAMNKDSFSDYSSLKVEEFAIDHHPNPNPNINGLNPYLYGLDSNYTTGFLTSNIIFNLIQNNKKYDLNIKNIKPLSYFLNITNLTLYSDKSKFSKNDEKIEFLSNSIDYLLNEKKSLSEIEKILDDEKNLRELEKKQLEKKEQILYYIDKNISNKNDIYFLDTKTISKKINYKKTSIICNLAQDKLNKENKTFILFGICDNLIVIRVSNSFKNKYFDANFFINQLKKDMEILGGGHELAASFSFKKNKNIKKIIIKKVEKLKFQNKKKQSNKT